MSRDKRRPPVAPRRDLELEAGSRAHYEDPAYYADTYASRDRDVLYYVEAARGRRSVLEYGIGNGRIALPLARSGVHVTGIDASAEMLGDLRARLSREPPSVRARVRALRGDMRKKRLGARFDLVICPFNGLLHLYTRADMERFLARAREHLAPGGELVFDVSLPVPADLARDPARGYATPPFSHPTLGRVKYREHFDYDGPRQILFVTMVFTTADGATFHTPLAHRQFFPQELEALLHYNGFETRSVEGDFDGGALTNESEMMLFRARPRGAASRRAR